MADGNSTPTRRADEPPDIVPNLFREGNPSPAPEGIQVQNLTMGQLSSRSTRPDSHKEAGTSSHRLLGLDWLRAMAAILVVLLHAALPYLNHPFPGLIWAIQPLEQSHTADLIAWSINSFIMPLFFVMNGYFAARLLQRSGEGAFLRHRLKRLGGPFLFAAIVILPMDLYIWLLGWVGEELIPINKMRSLKIRGELGDSLHGVAHLWFLQYVLLYCVASCGVSWLFRRLTRTPGSSQVLSFQRAAPSASGALKWTALTLAIGIAGATLWWQPRIVIGFRHNWLPMWENLLYYAVPFSLGWFWDSWAPRSQEGIPLRRTSAVHIALACGLFIALWPQLCLHLENETIPVQRAQVPFLFAATGILASTGLFAGALSLNVSQIPEVIRYLSKASFWIYLFHHPMVGLVQINLKVFELAPLVKTFLTTGITLGVCLLTYEGWVRKTWLGLLLNGVRESTARVAPSAPVSEESPVRRAA